MQKNSKINLSIIFPVYNEEKVLEQNTLKTLNYLQDLNLINKFEILLCPNACTDDTVKIAQKLSKKDRRIKCYPKKEKGIGVGLREGIKNAKYEYSMFYAIDLPFGLEVIESSIKNLDNFDIIIGSKAHKDSTFKGVFERKLLSFSYNALLRILFGLKIKDTQGSLLFKTRKIKKFLNKLNSDTAFMETQILIYGVKNGLKIKEIPVKANRKFRESKINPLLEGARIIKDIIKYFINRKH